MSISFSGVGSGLPVTDWIESLMAIERRPLDQYILNKSNIEKSKMTLNTMEGKVSSLRSQIERLTDGNITSSMDLFKKRLANSSVSTIATASATSDAIPQSIKLKIESLATSSKAQSLNGVSKIADLTTKITDLSNKSGSTGTFSIYVDGKKEEFTIEDDSTLGDVVSAINTKYTSANGYQDGSVVASISNGKFSIEVNESVINDFKLGSSSDKSNFLNVTQLATTKINVGTAENPVWKVDKAQSSNQLSLINTSGLLTSNEVNLNTAVTAGTFKIGNAEFTVDENSTLGSVINKINNDSESGVTAQFDARSNKLTLTAKNPGETTINLENGTSNFLTSMGLLNADGTIVTGTQTLGDKAKVYINDSTNAVEFNSNTLSSDISGIAGVSINLLKVSTGQENGSDTVEINVSQDTGKLVSSINDFLSKFNEVINEVDKLTASNGALKNETGLFRLRSDFRSTISRSVEGLSTYNNFAMIGISSGSVGASVSANIKNISLDEAKFKEALEKNPDDVRALLLGDSDKGIKGIMQLLEEKTESALDIENGYFKSRKNSMEATIATMNKSIELQEQRMVKRRETLTAQFSAMDRAISEMKSQGGALAMIGF